MSSTVNSTARFVSPLLLLLVSCLPLAVAADGENKADEKKADEKQADEKTPAPASIFPDPSLEAAIRAEVFEKRYNDEPITAEDVRNISRVVGIGKDIKSLEGLQHCKALMLIDLADNKISDLKPVADLKRLQSVTLANNQIKDLKPLEGLTAMQLLDLSGNQVDDLAALKKMSNLRSLYVANNKLTSIEPIAGLSKIWSLDVSGNQLTDLSPVSKLGWLTTLNVAGNQIESLEPLKSLSELDMLLISGNKITDLAPLVQMCQQDAQGARRFAPYMEVYLGKNPIPDDKLAEQKKQLESFGVDIHTK